MTMRTGKKSGFTLLELGLVLIVLSLLASGILTMATQSVRIAKKNEIEMKMDAIYDAIINYRKAYGYIPCPADPRLADSNQYFGFQGTNPGNCTDGTPATNFQAGNTSSVKGDVPVRTLGLPDSYAYDPWGGRFIYAVQQIGTLSGGFSAVDINDTNPKMTIFDSATGTQITDQAFLVLLSLGPNGHGARQANAVIKYVGSTNTYEQENCSCTAAIPNSWDDGNFYIGASTSSSSDTLNNFDDIGRFYTKWQITSATDQVIETH
jgi:type II secretory pathway pseudopilin PulG